LKFEDWTYKSSYVFAQDIQDIRIALGAVARTPIRSGRAEKALLGLKFEELVNTPYAEMIPSINDGKVVYISAAINTNRILM
jgi:CO/xanthine dehydrogenase FAD-binding subunit